MMFVLNVCRARQVVHIIYYDSEHVITIAFTYLQRGLDILLSVWTFYAPS